jgi:uncharacterized protein YybS (DUF2232 family)
MVKEVFLSSLSSLALLLAGVTIPGVGIFFLAVCPQPVLRQCARSGLVVGGAVVIATTLVSGLLLGWIAALSYFFLLGSPSVFHITLLRRGWKTDSLIVLPVAILVVVATTAALFLSPGTQILNALQSQLTHHLEASLAFHERVFSNSEAMDALREQIPTLANMVMQVLPALSFIGLGMVGLLNILFLRSRWNKQASGDVTMEDLKKWRTPEELVWLLIASGYALFIPVPVIEFVALNFLIILIVLYFLQGLAILSHFFQKKGVPALLQILGYALIILEQVLALVIAAIGLFDLWGDFRGLKTTSPTSGREREV